MEHDTIWTKLSTALWLAASIAIQAYALAGLCR